MNFQKRSKCDYIRRATYGFDLAIPVVYRRSSINQKSTIQKFDVLHPKVQSFECLNETHFFTDTCTHFLRRSYEVHEIILHPARELCNLSHGNTLKEKNESNHRATFFLKWFLRSAVEHTQGVVVNNINNFRCSWPSDPNVGHLS